MNVLAFTLGLCAAVISQTPNTISHENECGYLALFTATSDIIPGLQYRQIQGRGLASSQGVSMDELVKIAGELQLNVYALKLTANEIARLKGRFIVLAKPKGHNGESSWHYYALFSNGDGRIQIVDFPHPPRLTYSDWLEEPEQGWDGSVLFISEKPRRLDLSVILLSRPKLIALNILILVTFIYLFAKLWSAGHTRHTWQYSSIYSLGLVIAVILIAMGLSPHVSATTDSNEPRAFMQSNTLDVGTVNKPGDIPFEFSIKNIGGKSLVINEVKTSCSCTDITVPKTTIDPGKDVVIGGTIAVSEPPGRTAAIYVETNDRNQSLLEVEIRAVFKKGYERSKKPLSISIVEGEKANPISASFTFLSSDTVLSEFEYDRTYIRHVKEIVRTNNEVTVEITPNDYVPGAKDAVTSVYVHTAGDLLDTILIPIALDFRRHITLPDSSIVLDTSKPQVQVSFPFQVDSQFTNAELGSFQLDGRNLIDATAQCRIEAGAVHFSAPSELFRDSRIHVLELEFVSVTGIRSKGRVNLAQRIGTS